MKKSLVFGILIFFVGSMMVGCGKSSKSASSPTPAADTSGTANVTDIATAFGANTGTSSNTLNIVGKPIVVVDVNAFNSLIGNTGYANGIVNQFTNGLTGNNTFDQLIGCGIGSALQFGIAYGLNEFFGSNNTNTNISSTCIGNYANNGTVNGINGTNNVNGITVSQGQTFLFNGQVNATNLTGTIATSSAISPFFTFSGIKETQSSGAKYYKDNARNAVIAADSQNALGLYYNNGSQWVKAGTIQL